MDLFGEEIASMFEIFESVVARCSGREEHGTPQRSMLGAPGYNSGVVVLLQERITVCTSCFQGFVYTFAGLADELASGSGGAGTMQSSLSKLSEAAEDSTGGQVAVTANMDGNQVRAEFSCDNGRTLAIVVTIRDDGTYRIDKWKMTAVQNEEEPAGKLWTGN